MEKVSFSWYPVVLLFVFFLKHAYASFNLHYFAVTKYFIGTTLIWQGFFTYFLRGSCMLCFYTKWISCLPGWCFYILQTWHGKTICIDTVSGSSEKNRHNLKIRNLVVIYCGTQAELLRTKNDKQMRSKAAVKVAEESWSLYKALEIEEAANKYVRVITLSFVEK